MEHRGGEAQRAAEGAHCPRGTRARAVSPPVTQTTDPEGSIAAVIVVVTRVIASHGT
jgi:hypothetical protein